ncbi:Kinesin-like protein [Fulvia fulva]|uniref:Kinesin-like protein n=1 Tax=Passalora fulva TaxID=5499 RepID=A0A9Q8P327_PASFU|nr:Kinesin-like protein [Fulvia fulva]KAK4636195.1 Kinesin-like protein [Fulvia fulva]KAK4637754.1 Kinesin-like protein [Fulvia fulva]UJO11503.1 Kinesin-like protein [Fulvia fulva]WPV09555.1 Kinesin-like protein [Fulvia fulva]WPV25032.1 Kinesin-like protein [Fulvia fulva]
MSAAGGGNIKVVVRVRPFNSREIDRKAKCIVSMKDSQTVLTPAPPDGKSKAPVKAALEGSKTFAFDKSYWSFNRKDSNFAGQDAVFTDLGRPLLDNAFQGYNNCIFAYGQTGSGKSYSMMGYGEEEGVIPRICRDMFERIEGLQSQDKNTSATVEVSYLEIYNERVRDLLNPSNKGNLKVREHPSTGPYVEDLAKLVVRNFSEIDNLMDEGNKARTVAATNMNETSSRSHAVFTLILTQKRHDVETNMDTEKVAKISLVDLAGSERATSTGATGARLKEGAEINRSLSTLGRVIAALADMSTAKAKSKGLQVPYRDSVLTWLLKDSLGGNSLTAMIAAISPADINFEETLSTLRYADSAKRIKNHAVVNEDPNARMIRELKEELSQLRSKLATGGGVAEEQYSADTPLEKQIVSFTNADGTVKKVSKAEIQEQLSQSEKLYKDLNQTWEEKLTMTEQIHKEREAALEELGISIEKGFVGLSTPKKMPHLVNLSDDPLLAECLVYNLKPGTTTVGNVDTNAQDGGGETNGQSLVDIRLNGSKILHDHCTFENVDGVVTVVPKDGAAIMVNGIRIEAPKRLRSGYRVILGDFHIFRFNHPQEAREERAEQGSMLKYSITADQLDTPSRRAGHERTESSVSRPLSDIDGELGSPGTESPTPWRTQGQDSDWAFARREAISSSLGPDQKVSDLTDDQLDVLFEDLQRVRAVRKARPDSRIFDISGADTDTESVSSHPVREKYLSNGTLDNFSLDTALTIPSTPQHSEDEERLKQAKDEMEDQLEKQKEDYQHKLQNAEEGSFEIEELRTEKVKMEASLQEMKEQMQKLLSEQKVAFERQLRALKAPPKPRRKSHGKLALDEREIYLAKYVLEHWRHHRYVALAAAVLKNASTLKEAQVMSQQMERSVVFQFTVADAGHTFGSSYDLVLNGVSAEESNDPNLHDSIKPCLAIRVIDFGNSVVHLWSIEKLHKRVRAMRQMLQYLDRPEYMQHFHVGNPFDEDCMPQYTRVGDADIPLAAVFECRVQDFTLDVYSPYTCSIVGVVHLSLEPSSAEAPSSTLKFNVVMHDLIGFAEREGTNVHAQLFIPGVSEEGGATTTSLVSGFGESAVRFESVHSMSLPLSAPQDASLRVSIFAEVTSMHLDKLLSWDDMRDASKAANIRPKNKRNHSRIPEHEYYADERHDVFVRAQILEINEDGNYQPVEVVQGDTLDQGAYQLHQGLQRRVVLGLTHYSGKSLPWKEVDRLQACAIRLLDSTGMVTDSDSNQPDVPLSLISPPVIRNNDDGTTNVKLTAQWDSSAHGSLLLDRPTLDKNRVQLTLKWQVHSPRVTHPLKFATDIAMQTRPRTWFRQNSLLGQFFHNQRVVHSTATNYTVTLKPSAAKRAGDLWRMDTTGEYISGEEVLSSWAPRSVSLIRDYVNLRKRQKRVAEIESARGILGFGALSPPVKAQQDESAPFTESQQALIRKTLELWPKDSSAGEIMLLRSNTESPELGAAFTNGNTKTNGTTDEPAPLAAVIEACPKSPNVLKAGWLLCPDASGTHWIKTYVELRRPYLHLYSKEGDEVNAINLTNSRLDADPEVAKLLQRPNVRMEVWAIYSTKAWLFACRNDQERGEWIWAVDRSYLS